MNGFRPDDTIVALATADELAPLGIVRLSGPAAHALLAEIAEPSTAPSAARMWDARLMLEGGMISPASVLSFHAPRSYTGQDLVELHAPGNPLLLRRLLNTLIRRGARPALPGEFTARAYLNGRLKEADVEAIGDAISAGAFSQDHQRLRTEVSADESDLESLRQRLVDLLARVEAGIDFVDEEDVRFIAEHELFAELQACAAQAQRLEQESSLHLRARLPHVALAGWPNAGKSTLFNALLQDERAIVSPSAGATRDVLSALWRCDGRTVVLQDCAGLDPAAHGLEQAGCRLALQAVAQADVVLWLCPLSTPLAIPVQVESAARRLLVVRSRADEAPASAEPFSQEPRVSARFRIGLDKLESAVSDILGDLPPAPTSPTAGRVHEHIRDACGLVERGVAHPELVSLGLRQAILTISRVDKPPVADQVLARIFAHFCIGK